MKKQRFSETQIVSILKQYEGGREAIDVCRENGISKATLYNWKKKYSGMEASHVKELKALQDENRRLKQMYCGTNAGSPAGQTYHRKKVVKLCHKRELVAEVISQSAISVGRACRVIQLQKSAWYYKGHKDDSLVIDKLRVLAACYPTRGFDVYYRKIRNEGLVWNRKRVLRVYRSIQLSLRRKHKRRLPQRIKERLQTPIQPNEVYSMDFMSDALTSGRRLRVLKVIDDCTRESVIAHADYSIPAEKVVEMLEQAIQEKSEPKKIRVDNGPEFRSKYFVAWCEKHNINIHYIQPGKPMQNGYIERLNRTFREDVLDAYQFDTLEEVRILCDEWQYHYNHYHPHESLGGKTPLMARM